MMEDRRFGGGAVSLKICGQDSRESRPIATSDAFVVLPIVIASVDPPVEKHERDKDRICFGTRVARQREIQGIVVLTDLGNPIAVMGIRASEELGHHAIARFLERPRHVFVSLR
jgi:hypothetical protein